MAAGTASERTVFMSLHTVRRGFDIRLAGAPAADGPADELRVPSRIALLGADYPGMRPTIRVREGDSVSRGSVLFEDKKTAGVRFTAPLAGRVAAVHRGERRAFVSMVIEVSPEERSGGGSSGHATGAWSGRHPDALGEDAIRELLLESGEWTGIRTRPFGRVADPGTRPHAIFVTATDTAPLAPDPVAAVSGRETDLAWGVAALSRLTQGPVFVCSRRGRRLPVNEGGRVRHEEFAGPHPSGSAGLHIHRLAPVRRGQEAWHLDAQDLASIGKLFRTGAGDSFRVVSLGGPPVRRPTLMRAPIGASLEEFATPESGAESGAGMDPADRRVIAGSLLSGRTAAGDVTGYLGRYHRQVTVLDEDRRRRFLGWLTPGFGALSVSRAFLSAALPARAHGLTTGTHGSRRAIVPIPAYDRVMAFDIPPVLLLRALLMEDIERAEELGALELIEEDMGLLTFACPAKNDYAPALRRVLDTLEKEG